MLASCPLHRPLTGCPELHNLLPVPCITQLMFGVRFQNHLIFPRMLAQAQGVRIVSSIYVQPSLTANAWLSHYMVSFKEISCHYIGLILSWVTAN